LILWLYEPKYAYLPSILKDATAGDVNR
jgi:hypothetical protein